ncbi:MAG: phytanoyl-CoA dioxygenase family protein [Rhizomicrobium sp.]|jgi:phosphonate degradation associated HDIG domain protein
MNPQSEIRRELEELYGTRAHDRYGLEAISQLEHALQAAAAAEASGEPPAMMLATLLHDIGHLIAALGENPAETGIDDRHEIVGSDWLAKRLGASVAEPVRLHVSAKRYLCATDPDYMASLAPDSVLSLKLQGGPMSAAETADFGKRPFAQDAIRLRRFDETVKDPEARTPDFAHFLRYLPAARIGAGEREMFRRDGAIVLRDFFTAEEADALNRMSRTMGDAAAKQLARARLSGRSPAQLARENPKESIVVPEAADAAQVCRFEYLQGAHPEFRAFVAARIAPAIEGLAAEAFVPFKDKENEKHPGGGAFGAHQDFAAYQAFGPRYNITAMLTIDPATRANGCLEFARDWRERARESSGWVERWIEGRPLLRFNDGGPKHGDVLSEIEAALDWQIVETAPTDLVLFDSFVPHRSSPNRSAASRRAMFLTFNAAREGEWYERYYADKRENFDDPKFHVSTPTAYAARG